MVPKLWYNKIKKSSPSSNLGEGTKLKLKYGS